MNTIDILKHLKEEHSPISYEFAMNKFPSVIMITGGNGFLASYLIKELSNRKDVTTIYALVRNNKNYINDEKIKYIEYKGSSSFVGNELDDLMKKTDCFIHCAAEVNNIKKLSAMYDVNVEFTHNILNKISELKLKCSFHYVSTLSVFASSNLHIKEYLKKAEDRLVYLPPEQVEISQDYEIFGGYAQTKWLSEYILSKTNANIFRLGLITPDSENPVFNENEFLTKILNKLISEPFVPFINKEELFKNTCSTRVDITPVNYASKFMSDIIFKNYYVIKENNVNYTNIANHMSVSLWQIYNRLSDICGKNHIKYLDKAKYLEKISDWKKIDKRVFENAFYRENIVYNGEMNFNCDLFQTSLFDWSYKNKSGNMPISIDIIDKYLECLRNKK